METNNKKVYLAATSYSVITGLSFLFGKVALGASNPLDLLAFRFTASFLAIIIASIIKPVKLNYTKENILKILPMAILYPLLFFAFQTYGLKYTSSSEAGILQAAMPVFTLIMATYFLDEKTSILQKLSIILSVLGVIYITIMKSSTISFSNIKGIILILLSTLSFSSYSVMARGLTKDFSSIELSYIMIFISFISFNVLSLGSHIVNGTLSGYLLPLMNLKFIIAVIYLGVLSSLVTSLLTNYVLSKIEASKMVVFSNLGTVISIIAGVVFLKEDIFYYHIIGSVFIVGGVLGANFLDKKTFQKKPSK